MLSSKLECSPLQLSTTLYQSLQNLANQTRRSPEKIATGLLEKDLQIIDDDPVDEFIGAFQTNIPALGTKSRLLFRSTITRMNHERNLFK